MADIDEIPDEDAIEQEAEDIRRQTQDIRERLPEAVDEIKVKTEQLTDWRYYVRTYPAATLIAAAALGYLIVPPGKRKPRVQPPPAKTLASCIPGLAQPEQVPEEPPKSSIMDALLAGISSVALKAVAGFAGDQITQMLSPKPPVTEPEKNGEQNAGVHPMA